MKYLRIMLMAFLASVLAACGGGGDSADTTAGTGTISVKMTDAPATPEYREVWVTVEKVRFHKSETDPADSDAGWQEIEVVPAKKIDLLKLRNGILADLGQVEVPAGQYHQFRLVLGSGKGADGRPLNELVFQDGKGQELTTPSGQQSGIKLNAKPFVVEAGQTVELVFDFDAARSIVKAGNSGKFNLKPVITVIPLLDAGEVSGTFAADAFADFAEAARTSITLQVYDDSTDTVIVLRSTTPNFHEQEGVWKWRLAPVLAGSNYNLVFTNPGVTVGAVTSPGYRPLVMTGVTLAEGQALDVGPLALTAAAADSARVQEGIVSGSVDPQGAEFVRALQRVVDDGSAATAGDIVVELASMNADDDTGAFAFVLTADKAEVRPAAGGPSSDGKNAGKYTLAASTATSSGEVEVDVNPADPQPVANIVLAP